LIVLAVILLKGRRATTHWLAMDQLAGLGTVPAAGGS
jgi:transcriptional regulator GlxA family with amidase domain